MTESKELIVKENIKPAAVFSAGGSKELLERIAKLARSNVYDMSTKKGKDQLRSDAMKIAKSRTWLNEQREELLEHMKVATKAINVEWHVIEDFLKDLQEEIRKPLTDLEEAEKARLEAIDARIDKIQQAAADIVFVWDTAAIESMKSTLHKIEAVSLTDGSWGKRLEDAVEAKESAVTSIEEAITKREVADKQAAELEVLRKQAEETAAKERDDAIRREAEENVRKEAEDAARKAEEEKAAAIAEKEAAEQALEDAEEAAAEQKRSAELAAENAEKLAKYEAQQAEAAKKEAAKLAAEKERERIAEENRVAAAEVAAREDDIKHKRFIHNAALDAIVKECGVEREVAKSVVTAIKDDLVPNVRIEY